MGNGTAWGGRLACTEDSRSVRIRYSPPNNADIAQLAEAVGSNPTQYQFKSDYPYQMYLTKIMVVGRSPKPCSWGSNPQWDANFNNTGDL